MRVFFSPIVGLVDQIQYTFDEDKITIQYKGVTDVFDFTGLPDGTLDATTIETVLEINAIQSVEKIDGILYVELLNRIDEEDSEFHRFPEWIEV